VGRGRIMGVLINKIREDFDVSKDVYEGLLEIDSHGRYFVVILKNFMSTKI
jgi:cobyric acid synthase